LPILQAEQDLAYMRAMERNRKLEAIATADDPSWEVGKSVYNRNDVALNIFINEKGEIVPLT
jgi:hypothetical protein